MNKIKEGSRSVSVVGGYEIVLRSGKTMEELNILNTWGQLLARLFSMVTLY